MPARKETVEERVRRLEAELEGLRRSVLDFGGTHQDAAAAARLGWIPLDTPQSPAPPLPTLPPSPAQSPPDARVAAPLEVRFGGGALAYVGAGIVVLGLVFFYALVQESVPAAAKFAAGLLLGAGAWAGGLLLHRKKSVLHGDVATVAGAVLAYYTLFAGVHMDDFAQELGLGPMVLVPAMVLLSAALLVQGHRRDREAYAAGGLGFVAITLFFPAGWPPLQILYSTLFLCTLVLLASRQAWTRTAIGAGAVGYLDLTVYFGSGDPWTGWSVAAASVALLVSFQDYLRPKFSWAPEAPLVQFWPWLATGLWIRWSVDGATLAPLIVGFVALARCVLPAPTNEERPSWAAAGLALLAFWAFDTLSGPWVAGAWAILTVAVGAVRWRLELRSIAVDAAGLALSGLTAGWVLWQQVPRATQEEAWVQAVCFGVAAAAPLLWLVRTSLSPPLLTTVAVSLAWVPALAWLAIWFNGIFLTLAWVLLATAVLAAGFVWHLPEVRIPALGAFGVVTLRLLFVDLAQANVLVRVLAFIAVGVVLFLASLLYARLMRAPAARAVAA